QASGDSSFGASVAGAGDVNHDGYADIIVGAPTTPLGGNFNCGRVHVYLGGPSGPQPLVPAMVLDIDSPDGDSSKYGTAVASAGAVAADGFADVIVGAPGTSNGSSGGRIHLYRGSASGLQPAMQSTVLNLDGPNGTSAFGQAVSTAGDVNGDGFADVIVG